MWGGPGDVVLLDDLLDVKLLRDGDVRWGRTSDMHAEDEPRFAKIFDAEELLEVASS